MVLKLDSPSVPLQLCAALATGWLGVRTYVEIGASDPGRPCDIPHTLGYQLSA